VDDKFYDAHIRPMKELSDRWWQRTVKKLNGALPVPLCKYWGEIMGMAGGHVRPPLADMLFEEKSALRAAIDVVRKEVLSPMGDRR
jgi:dihydrodipicolinate synthase/N-acetylneuraminate lyase